MFLSENLFLDAERLLADFFKMFEMTMTAFDVNQLPAFAFKPDNHFAAIYHSLILFLIYVVKLLNKKPALFHKNNAGNEFSKSQKL